MCIGPLVPPQKPTLAPPPASPAPAAVLGDRLAQDSVKATNGMGGLIGPNRGAATLRVDLPQIPR